MSHVEKIQNVFQEELITSNANVDGAIKVRTEVHRKYTGCLTGSEFKLKDTTFEVKGIMLFFKFLSEFGNLIKDTKVI